METCEQQTRRADHPRSLGDWPVRAGEPFDSAALDWVPLAPVMPGQDIQIWEIDYELDQSELSDCISFDGRSWVEVNSYIAVK